MANDMVLNQDMNPAYIHTPENTKKWLRYQLDQGISLRGYRVRIGSTMEIVSLSQYLRGAPSSDSKGVNQK